MPNFLRSIWGSSSRSGATCRDTHACRPPKTRWNSKAAIAATLILLVVGPFIPPALVPFVQNVAFAAPPAARSDDSKSRYVPGELLVRFADGASDVQMNSIHAQHGSSVVKKFGHVRNLHHVTLAPGVGVKQAIERYRRQPGVLYAEPNWIVHAVETVPGDTMFDQLWGLRNTGQTGGLADADIDATNAWDLTKGSRSVVVAVLDTGVDYTHPDLAANIYQGDCTGVGVDNDANGYVDDCHGWNALVSNGDPMDDNGHGTHVSGTIGAVGNNNMGVAGVNWQVTIIACKFMDSTGSGTNAGAITCLDYVAAQKDHGVNIVATSNSWGGTGFPFSQALMDAIDAQRARGILFIAAAGNNATDNDAAPFYPASYFLPNVISVAATAATDALAWFSSHGHSTVHLGAPGDSILSTTPSNTYGLMSGTSMATPHVAGVAALVKAYQPGATWVELKNLILAGGDSISSMAGTTVSGKRLNAYGSLTCSNAVVIGRVQPPGSIVTGSVGSPLPLDALDINCGAPNGGVTVTIHRDTAPVGTLSPVALQDAGGTGVYGAQWSPPDYGRYTLTFPNSDSVTFPSGDPVRVDVPYPYNFATTAYSYRNITVTGTNLNMGDDTSASVTPGFPIQFGGLSYDTVYVNSNGTLNFTAPFTDYYNASLPDTAVSTLIAPFWDDLVADPTHNVFWAVSGSPGSRELVIEWRDVWRYNCSAYPEASVRFQVVFFESKSDILFNYADAAIGANCATLMGENLDFGASATVGVQTGPAAASTFSFDSAKLANNMALLWTTVAASPPPPALSVTPVSLGFGNVAVGATSNLTFTVTNTGGGTLTGTATTAASGFCVVVSGSCSGSGASFSLAAGASQSVTVRFSPASSVTYSGNVSFASNGGNVLPSVTGTGTAASPLMSVTPGSLSFGNVAVGATASQSFTVRNTGAGILTGSASTSTPGFCIVVSGSCSGSGASFSLAAGASQSVVVRFSPTSSGSYSGNVSFNSNGGSVSPAITGTGTAANPLMSVTPSSLSFGNVSVGTTANLTFTVRNPGGGTLTGSASTTASGFCVVVSGSCSGSGASFSIAAGARQSVTVRFNPTSIATYSGNVSFTSNGGNASPAVAGTGTAPKTIQVTSPNGGEIWASNSSELITWSGTGITSNVQIRVSRDGGNSWSTIFSSTPSSATGGSRAWTVTGSATTRARIRICTTGSSPNVCDNSNANFTIQ
jgi:subtilisin family serine protease